MSRNARKPSGFTLVELLVVITIIGILVSMLMPAIQAAREAGRRVTCKNNLHQIGTACLAHDAKHGHFPSSGWGYKWTGDPDRGVGHSQPGGWIYNILPFMGATGVHHLGIDIKNASAKKDALTDQKAVVIPTFHCPSRRRAIGYPAVETSHNAGQPKTLAKTDYAANGGTVRVLGGGPKGTLECLDKYPNCDWSNSDEALAEHFDGVSGERSQVKAAHITDGIGSTLLAAEKYLSTEYYHTGTCCADNNSMYQGNDWDTNRWVPAEDLSNVGQRRPLQDTPLLENCTERFGSSHPAGFHLLLCDGSARLAPFGIDVKVLSHLGNRRDGEPIANWEW